MKIKVWTAITDNGDGSNSSYNYPSEEKLRADLELDEEDFRPYDDRPVEIDWHIMDISEYEVVEP